MTTTCPTWCNDPHDDDTHTRTVLTALPGHHQFASEIVRFDVQVEQTDGDDPTVTLTLASLPEPAGSLDIDGLTAGLPDAYLRGIAARVLAGEFRVGATWADLDAARDAGVALITAANLASRSATTSGGVA